MARQVERLLVWFAAIVATAAIVAVVINVVPGIGTIGWLHLGRQSGQGADATVALAEQAMRRGDARRALSLAQEAITQSPSDAAIANRAGNVALRAGDSAAAERYYLAGESADRGYAWNFVELGQLYEREGKRELADEQLRAAGVAAPGQPFIHYDLGVVELEEGLYAAALADFESELRRSPSYRPAMVGRAEALEKLGRKGEAVALYRRAGVDTQKNATPPKLAVKQVAAPSPTPLPSPSPEPSATTPAPTPKSVATRHRIAQSAGSPAAQTQPTATAAPTPARPPWATVPPSPQGTLIATAPRASVKPIAEVAADARGYLLDVAQDLDFTRSLPAGDPGQTTAALRFALTDALARKPVDIEALLRIGTSALLSGRLTLASAAFNAAADAAPSDWRGPYFAGLTAQADGDEQQAQSLFGASLARAPRAETYTSIALVQLQQGATDAASVNARRAADLNPFYSPGRFVAGMVDLLQSDLKGAEINLTAAQALGGAPARTAYFLSAVHDMTGDSGRPNG